MNNFIDPIYFDFNLLTPYLSYDQNYKHYNGHYMKYISNLNDFIKNDKVINDLYFNIKKNIDQDKFRIYFLLYIVKNFDVNSNLVHNVAQIYNHELYWNSLINIDYSLCYLCSYKNKLFISDQEFNNFYKKFIDLGSKHFASGWLWIIYKNNKLDIITTQDAIIPLNLDYIIVIDLWEHAYYVDYTFERKKYLQNIFKIINWNKIYNFIYKN